MSSSSSTTPLLPPPSIRQIWGVNAKEEFYLIENDEHPYVSIDTEFPGCIIKGSVLADLLVSSGVAGRENKVKAYVLFQGAYDLGYLVKLLSATELPSTLNDFLLELKNWFGKFYDVKYIIKKHQMHGGLDRIAEFLDLKKGSRVTHDTDQTFF
ncbi:probable CCR4-associated factor 1 homolog 11 [Solanum stenotomum]|uniref:probable CCR4-associated factor 1 homolog 11 n=1 Tax=Solanum stenotomum TaxID=172797 RepID=UPI0020D1655D|nr:probable CCR4-associated factor 1 homolog 11 [Solanum stenotomum]